MFFIAIVVSKVSFSFYVFKNLKSVEVDRGLCTKISTQEKRNHARISQIRQRISTELPLSKMLQYFWSLDCKLRLGDFPLNAHATRIFNFFFFPSYNIEKIVQDATENSILGAQHIIKQHAIKRKNRYNRKSFLCLMCRLMY